MNSEKARFIASHVREALTTANVDLRRGVKSQIEALIADALTKADQQWPAFLSEQRKAQLGSF